MQFQFRNFKCLKATASGVIFSLFLFSSMGVAQDKSTQQAKDLLAPHALMVSSSLKGMRDSTMGLKSQLENVSNPTSPESLQHVSIYQKDMKHQLDQAILHDQELRGAIQNFPELSQSKDYTRAQNSIEELKRAQEDVFNKLGQKSYLMNKAQVSTDLNQLEKKLTEAINMTDAFSKRDLKIKMS